MPMNKEDKREYQREYMRKRRAGKPAALGNGNEHFIEELEWRPIPGYNDYAVSACGQVLSVARAKMRSNGRPHKIPAKVLKQNEDSKGYLQVGLYEDGIRVNELVARLVYKSWKEEIPQEIDIDHINSDKLDNRLENLQAVTRAKHARITLDRIKEASYQRGHEAGHAAGYTAGHYAGYAQALKDYSSV